MTGPLLFAPSIAYLTFVKSPDSDNGPTLDFLYTNIGRGHPFYLDGIAAALRRRAQQRIHVSLKDVFRVSQGRSRLAWHVVRWLYRHGSSGGFIGSLYARLRKDHNYGEESFSMNLLARDIRRAFGGSTNPLVVAHPSLVGMLAGRPNLIYQHGELVAPCESLVQGAAYVLVPTQSVAEQFIDAGYDRGQIVVTGLCIEHSMSQQADSAYRMRIERLQSDNELTGLFISSGAEPASHVQRIVAAASSVVCKGRAIVLAREGGNLERAIKARFGASPREIFAAAKMKLVWPENTRVVLALHRNRAEEELLSGSMFEHVDFVVAPPHERTNWAMGLGLPFFAVSPTIGPFAPLNLHLMLEAGVARNIASGSSADQLGTTIQKLQKNGELLVMAARGWERAGFDGFDRIADWFVDHMPIS